MGKIGKMFASVALTVLSHVAGAEVQHITAAIQDAEKVAALGPGQTQNSQIATVTENGNKYEIWLSVRRQ